MVLGLTLFCSAKLTCSLATHYTFKMYIYIHTYICVCVCIYNALQEKPLCRYKSNTLHVSKKFTSQYNLCYRWPLNKLSVFLIPLLNTYADLYPWCFWLGGLLQLGCSKGASPTASDKIQSLFSPFFGKAQLPEKAALCVEPGPAAPHRTWKKK